MNELRASDVIARPGETLVELRCPELEPRAKNGRCNHLLIRYSQSAGLSHVETFCNACSTRAEWRLQEGRRPVYKVTDRRV